MKKSDGQVQEKMRNAYADIRNSWLKIVSRDPFLPKEILPVPWYGKKAEKLARGLVI